jgi:hypothetical protein
MRGGARLRTRRNRTVTIVQPDVGSAGAVRRVFMLAAGVLAADHGSDQGFPPAQRVVSGRKTGMAAAGRFVVK